MNTAYRMTESPATGELKPVSVWESQRFQRFALITLGTALLLSSIAALTLKGDVDNLTQKKLPFIQSQVDRLPGR